MKRENPPESKPPARREIIKQATIASDDVLAGASCSQPQQTAPQIQTRKNFQWKMVTTWPKNFPGLGTGANYLARIIEEMSEGRIKIKVYGGGELVPPLGIFDAVSRGTAEMGASYHTEKGGLPGVAANHST